MDSAERQLSSLGGFRLASGAFVAVLLWFALGGCGSDSGSPSGPQLRALVNGKLVAADYWRDEPVILSAGYGFEGIIGLQELDEPSVRAAGGSWYRSLTCAGGAEPDVALRTSAAAQDGLARVYEGYGDHDDGLPIVFSWPVATETVNVTDFLLTLNTGERVTPHAAGMVPNWEDNERNTVVIFGPFGNRGRSHEADAVFPVRLEVVADDTPLRLVGPGGREVVAVGLSREMTGTPYDSGPYLVGAKLNRIGSAAEGEGGVAALERSGYWPNDEHALYDEGDFRLRLLTTGGFSPDGVTGMRPDDFEEFFRLHVNGADGDTVVMDRVGVDYPVRGGTLRIVGLSDLGRPADPAGGVSYDDCYFEDRDNYIDVILVGDEAAAREIAFLEIPAGAGGYRDLYNPGGPGPEPYPEVRYTAPGPADLEPVIIALDDPMRVSRSQAAGRPRPPA